MDRPLLTAITEIRAGGDGNAAAYVSPRVHETLRRHSVRVRKKRVERWCAGRAGQTQNLIGPFQILITPAALPDDLPLLRGGPITTLTRTASS